MTEIPVFFGAQAEPLFGVYHEPAGAARGPAFVFCNAFAEEKLWAHRVFVTYARHLAQIGHPVLRFDFRGTGDSGGDFSRTSVTTAKEDVQTAVNHVRHLARTPHVALLGLRLGASIACEVADDMGDVRQLVLWAPIVDGGRYMQELLRTNLATQMATYKEVRQDRDALVGIMRSGDTVNVDGYDLGFTMYGEVSGLVLTAASRRHRGPTLIVGVDRQPTPSVELGRLAGGFSKATLASVQEEPFWREIQRYYQEAPNLFAATNDWIASQ